MLENPADSGGLSDFPLGGNCVIWRIIIIRRRKATPIPYYANYAKLRVNVRVADREMLITLKVNSMRLTDKRDVIILCYEKPDAKRSRSTSGDARLKQSKNTLRNSFP